MSKLHSLRKYSVLRDAITEDNDDDDDDLVYVSMFLLNLNSLLVKRKIDNPSPGAVTGGN